MPAIHATIGGVRVARPAPPSIPADAPPLSLAERNRRPQDGGAGSADLDGIRVMQSVATALSR
ncbi:MAG: hypothetical protein JWM19_426 [Actinomycetia bacterium]|nr:hypothetical protein [Actinomycetes bacterium]